MIKCVKKFIAANKMCVLLSMAAFGLALGLTAAKLLTDMCCPAKVMAKKAKKAFKAVEDKISM